MTDIGMILTLWLAFAATWAIAAIGVKRDIRPPLPLPPPQKNARANDRAYGGVQRK